MTTPTDDALARAFACLPKQWHDDMNYEGQPWLKDNLETIRAALQQRQSTVKPKEAREALDDCDWMHIYDASPVPLCYPSLSTEERFCRKHYKTIRQLLKERAEGK